MQSFNNTQWDNKFGVMNNPCHFKYSEKKCGYMLPDTVRDCEYLGREQKCPVNKPAQQQVELEDNYTQRMKEQAAAEKVVIGGVGKDAEIVTNEKGGKQSKSPMAMHLVDPMFLKKWFDNPEHTGDRDEVIDAITDYMITGYSNGLLNAVFEVYCVKHHDSISDENGAIVDIAKVLQEGAKKYKPNNWRLIPQEEHINHALIHYIAHLMGDTQDKHLDHCMCRLMMAYATPKSEGFSYC